MNKATTQPQKTDVTVTPSWGTAFKWGLNFTMVVMVLLLVWSLVGSFGIKVDRIDLEDCETIGVNTAVYNKDRDDFEVWWDKYYVPDTVAEHDYPVCLSNWIYTHKITIYPPLPDFLAARLANKSVETESKEYVYCEQCSGNATVGGCATTKIYRWEKLIDFVKSHPGWQCYIGDIWSTAGFKRFD